MEKIEPVELLKNPEVVKEIHRYLWFESEKAGYDLGVEWAAEDWLNKFSKAWMDYHMPTQEISIPERLTAKDLSKKTLKEINFSAGKGKLIIKTKKRRAKSYINW